MSTIEERLAAVEEKIDTIDRGRAYAVSCPLCGGPGGRRGTGGYRNCLQHNGNCGELLLSNATRASGPHVSFHRTQFNDDGVVRILHLSYTPAVRMYFRGGVEMQRDQYLAGAEAKEVGRPGPSWRNNP